MVHRPGLDTEQVIQAAATLADQTGFNEVTLAGIAQSLGIRTPSLYNHITSLEGVRSRLAVLGTQALGKSMAQAAIGKAGKDAIVAACHAYRRFAKDHPGLYAATLRAPASDDTALIAAAEEIFVVMRAILAPYHLTGVAEMYTLRGLRSLVHGFVSLEMSGGFGLPVDLDKSFEVLIQQFILSLLK